MAANKVKNPPEMRKDLLYRDWKRELDIWSDFTDLPKTKQGPAVFLSLTGKARESVLAAVTPADMKKEDEVKTVTEALDKLYLKNDAESSFSVFDSFIKFKRPSSMTIEDYCIEFNIKLKQLTSYKMELPDGVIAYFLLLCANLTPEQTALCRATCAKLDYESMKVQLERVTMTSNSKLNSATQNPSSGLNVEFPAESFDYYEEQPSYTYENFDECEELDQAEHHEDFAQDGAADHEAYFNQRGASSSRGHNERPAANRPDQHGNPSQCRHCGSIYHWVDACPKLRRFPRGTFGYLRNRFVVRTL